MLGIDWVAASSIATAVATLVLAFATFASVRSANRAARATETSLLAGLRPVLMPSRPEDPPQMSDIFGLRSQRYAAASSRRTSSRLSRQTSSGSGGSTSSQIAANEPLSCGIRAGRAMNQ
jgi:hypothetical protein